MPNVALSRIILRNLLFIVPLWLVIRSVRGFSYPRGGSDGSSFPPRPGRTDWDSDPSPLQDYDTSDSEYSPEDASSMFGSSQQTDGVSIDGEDSLKDFDDEDFESMAFRSAYQSPIGDLAANDKETMYEAYNQLHTLAQVSLIHVQTYCSTFFLAYNQLILIFISGIRETFRCTSSGSRGPSVLGKIGLDRSPNGISI